ncbi:MAG TPA: serine hydrolase [Actinomycetota bacterium]|nr:serine hydrolase [Actinomycetota bacterium]
MRRGAARALAAVPLVVLALQAAAGGALSPQTAPPPTPLPPNGSPSPFLDRLDLPPDALAVPPVEARAALLLDLSAGQVLFERAAHDRVPIASLTKMMTALVVMERGRLDRVVRVDPAAVFDRGDYGASSTLGLRAGERISVRGLLGGLLLGSANDAAEALAIDAAGSVDAFVDRMNDRARELGMRRTRFASPHGLDDRGRSTAADLGRLIGAAMREPTFSRLVSRRVVAIRSAGRPTRRIQNRNVLLWLYRGTTGGKTGFTSGAGFCLVATARREGRELAAIVLGGGDEVFSDAAALLDHGFAAYQLRTLVEAGEPLGSVRITGGTVPIVADEDLAALVRPGEVDRIDRTLSTRPGAAYPPPVGSSIGTLTLRGPTGTLGRVPVVVADLAPPDPPPGPWWARATGALVRALALVVDGLVGSSTPALRAPAQAAATLRAR